MYLLFFVLISVLKLNAKESAFWKHDNSRVVNHENLLFDHVQTQTIENQNVRWLLSSDTSTLIGVGEKRIFLQGLNESAHEFEGVITSTAVNADLLFVATRNSKLSTIFSYKIAETLHQKWNKELELPVDHLAAWRNSIIITSGEKLEIYQETDFSMTATTHLPGTARDLKIIENENSLLIAVTLDNQISTYRLKNHPDHLEHFSDIPVKNTTSLALFSQGYNIFLAMNGPSASLWKLEANSFELTSKCENVDVFLAIPLSTYRHDSLLLAQRNESVFVFEPNGITNYRLRGGLSTLCPDCQDVELSQAHAAVDSVIFPLPTGRAIFLQLFPEIEDNREQALERIFGELTDLKANFSELFVMQNEEAEKLDTDSVLKLNETNVIEAEWVVKDMEIDEGEFVDTGDGEFQVEQVTFAGREWTEGDSAVDLKILKENWQQLLEDVGLFRDELHFESFETDINDVSDLPSIVDSGLTVKGRVEVQKLQVGRINGELTNEWISDCFQYGVHDKIYGIKTIPDLEAISIFAENVSGIPASDLIYSDSNERIAITGDLIFKSDVTIAHDVVLSPTGDVNDMDLRNDLFLVNIPFKGEPVFDSVTADDARIVEMSYENESVILPAHLSLHDIQPEVFEHIRIDNFIVEHDLNATEVNGVKFEKIFSGESNNDVFLNSLHAASINGKKFPEDFIITTDKSSKLLKGTKNFKNLTVRELETSMENFVDLLVTGSTKRSQAQPLVYVFNDVEVLQPLEAKFVNNVSLSGLLVQPFENRSWKKMSNFIDDEFTSLTVDQLQVQGSITTVDGEVSGYPISTGFHYLSKTKDQKIPAHAIKKITNLFTPDNNTKIHSVKTLNVTGELTVKNYTFLGKISAGDVTVNGPVSNQDFLKFYNDAVLKTDQSVLIRGRKKFKTLSANNINVFALNDWRLDEVATRQGEHEFSGPIVIKGRVHVRGDFNVLSHFNGINLTHVSDRVSTTFGAFLVPGDWTLAPNARVNSLSVDGLIQGENFTRFLDRTVSRKLPVQLEGKIQLNDVVIAGDLFTHTLNQLNISKLFTDIVLLNRSADIQDLVLAAGGVISNLVVEGGLNTPLVDGCDVHRWRDEAVSLDQDTYVPVRVRIGKLVAAGDASVDFLNNRSLGSLIPLKTSQSIPVKLIFENVAVEDHVMVNHWVNGVYLPDIWEKSLRHNASQTITGNTRFKSLTVTGSVRTEKINNVSISNFVTTYTNQTITGNLNFTGTVSVQNLTTTKPLSGIDIETWENLTMLTNINQTLDTSWTVTGNITAASIFGSGLVLEQDLRNISERLSEKITKAEEYNKKILENYGDYCKSVVKFAAKTNAQPRFFDMFDDIQGIEFSNEIRSAVFFENGGEYFLLLTFTGRCAGVLYVWSFPDARFIKKSRFKIGTVDSWAVLPDGSSTFLIMSGKPCDKSLPAEGRVWEARNSELLPVGQLDAFTDVLVDELKNVHTIAVNGSIATWSFQNGTVKLEAVRQWGLGKKLKFIPIDLGFGLSVWDDDHIASVENPKTGSRLPGDSVAVDPSSVLIATSDGLGVVEVYMNQTKELIDSLHFRHPSDLCWVDLKSAGELYLVFASDHHRIHVFQYKGVAGFLKRSTLPYPSSKLSVVNLPNRHPTPTPHMFVINKKTLRVLQVRMFGQPALDVNLEC